MFQFGDVECCLFQYCVMFFGVFVVCVGDVEGMWVLFFEEGLFVVWWLYEVVLMVEGGCVGCEVVCG